MLRTESNWKRYDITGQKFGKRTVVRRIGRAVGGGSLWLVRCECGKEQQVRRSELFGSPSRPARLSCRDCWKPSNTLPKGEAARNAVLDLYRRDAKKSNRVWGLSLEEFCRLTQGACHYCGKSPDSTCRREGNYNGAYQYNGIDRKDNRLGYVPENCVTCCSFCNHAKHTTSYQDFIAWIVSAAKHLEPIYRAGGWQ